MHKIEREIFLYFWISDFNYFYS